MFLHSGQVGLIHCRWSTNATLSLLRGLSKHWSEGQHSHIAGCVHAAWSLDGVEGFELPSWRDLCRGARLQDRDAVEMELGTVRRGWQHEAVSRVERRHRRETILPFLDASGQALLRSQSGPASGAALAAAPSNYSTRINADLFRVLLLRRLRLPLPPVSRTCRCGHLLDSFGHHRAACSRAGVLGRRGFALESAVARICREAGARVSTNVFVRDLDLTTPNVRDERRLEVVAEGLPLHGGAQLVIDTTLVSALRSDRAPRPSAATTDGVALQAARRRKERTYPELVGPGARAKLVVLAGEVAGRWSAETVTFIRLMAEAKSRSEPSLLRRRAECAWRLRWCSMLGCAAARACSLLDRRPNGGGDGDTPTLADVLQEHRHAGLG